MQGKLKMLKEHEETKLPPEISSSGELVIFKKVDGFYKANILDPNTNQLHKNIEILESENYKLKDLLNSNSYNLKKKNKIHLLKNKDSFIIYVGTMGLLGGSPMPGPAPMHMQKPMSSMNFSNRRTIDLLAWTKSNRPIPTINPPQLQQWETLSRSTPQYFMPNIKLDMFMSNPRSPLTISSLTGQSWEASSDLQLEALSRIIWARTRYPLAKECFKRKHLMDFYDMRIDLILKQRSMGINFKEKKLIEFLHIEKHLMQKKLIEFFLMEKHPMEKKLMEFFLMKDIYFLEKELMKKEFKEKEKELEEKELMELALIEAELQRSKCCCNCIIL